VRADATLETLQQATAALEKALRDKGFGLHRVALPPQEVGNTVKLRSSSSPSARSTSKAARSTTRSNIRRTLPELREGESPNFKTLAIQTAIANENPNKQIQVGLRESDEPDKIDATVTVKEQRPWTFGVLRPTWAPKNTGRDRLTLTGGHTNLFNRDHQFVGAYTTSIERPTTSSSSAWRTSVPLYALGGVLGASYTAPTWSATSAPSPAPAPATPSALNYTFYLPPQGGRRSYVTFGLDDKVFDASRINDVVVPGALDRRSRPVSVGYTARTETDTAVWGYNASWPPTPAAARTTTCPPTRAKTRASTRCTGRRCAAAPATRRRSQELAVDGARRRPVQPRRADLGRAVRPGRPGSVRGTDIERPISGDKGVSGNLRGDHARAGAGPARLGFVDAGYLGTTSPTAPPSLVRPPGQRRRRPALRAATSAARSTTAACVNGSKVPLAVNSSSPQRATTAST
jgi:hypothetical protein